MDYVWAFMTILLLRVGGRRMRKLRPERLQDEEIDNSLPVFPSPLPSHRFFYTRDEPPKDLMDNDYMTFDSTLVDITANRELEEKLMSRLDFEGPYPDWQDIEDEIQKLQKARNMEFRDEAAKVLERTERVLTSTAPVNSSTTILAASSTSTSTEKLALSSDFRVLPIVSTTTAQSVLPLTSTTSPFVPFDWTSEPGEVDLDAAVEIAEVEAEEPQSIESVAKFSVAQKATTSARKGPVMFSTLETPALSSAATSVLTETSVVNSTPVQLTTSGGEKNETMETSSTRLSTTIAPNDVADDEIERLVASLATAPTPKPTQTITDDNSIVETAAKSSLNWASNLLMAVFTLTVLRLL